MLGHYAGLAPLLSITSEYNRRLPGTLESSCPEQASSGKRAKSTSTVQPKAIQAIITQLECMTSKIDTLIQKEKALELAVDNLDERTSPCQYVLNIESARWHRSADSNGLAPCTHRAACGWRYGRASHHLAKRLPPSAKGKLICERCLPLQKSEAQLLEASVADYSSSSDSSGSVDE